VRTKQWSEFLRKRVKRARIAFLLKWAEENGINDYQCNYGKARCEFPMASKENTHCYVEVALKILKKKRPFYEERATTPLHQTINLNNNHYSSFSPSDR